MLKRVRRGWVVVGVIVVVVVVAGLLLRDYYFNDRPRALANDYREEAEPAAARITDSMDGVYDSFDEYLLDSTISARALRNVDDIDEVRRRLVPVYDSADRSVHSARRQIQEARAAMKRNHEELLDTPTGTWLNDSEPIDETEAVAGRTRAYLRRAEGYLKAYERFLEYEEKDIDLHRRRLKIAAQNEIAPDADLEEVKSAVAAELEETQALRRARQELEPAPDTEDLDAHSLESLNITIDYLQRTSDALDALDQVGLEAAADDYLAEIRGMGTRESTLIAELSADSRLRRSAEKLSKRADALEDAVQSVADGEERSQPPRRRPPPIPMPKEPSSPDDDEGERVS